MTKLLFYIIIGIYNSVAKAYYLLNEFSNSTNLALIDDAFGNLIDKMYVLAGLFMLFRITVTFLNMLIDPDKVSDKQVGAGAVLKRVFVSLILIIICNPSNFCFGLLDKVEEAIIGTSEDSLINNIFSGNMISTRTTSKGLSIMFDDVYAASNEFSCFYNVFSVRQQEINYDKIDTDKITGMGQYYEAMPYSTGQFYITFTRDSSWKKIEYKWGKDSDWYIKFNNSGTTPSGKKYDNSQLNSITSFKFNTTAGKTSYMESNVCPQGITFSNGKAIFSKESVSGTVVYGSYATYLSESASNEERIAAKITEAKKNINKNSDKVWNGDYYSNQNNVDDFYANDPTLTSDEKNTATTTTMEYAKSRASYKEGTDAGSIKFARSIFLVFTDNIYDDPDVDEKLNTVLDSPEANGDVFDLINNTLFKDAVVELDSLMAIVVGIVVIVYLLLLCIDVVVRQFKLLILEVMAPIPIISYIDPQNKIFDEWKKMLISVYADLFIKILAIKLGINIIDMMFNSYTNYTGLKKIMVLFAIFVFMKALPSIINKIFGIDASANSFKEIGNVVKAGAGIAAGGAIGGVAALGTGFAAVAATGGQGVGNTLLAAGGAVGRLFSGTLRGMGGGSRGNVTAGLSASRTNLRNRQAYANGVTASTLAGASLLGGIGMDYASRRDREVAEMKQENENLQRAVEYKDNIENTAIGYNQATGQGQSAFAEMLNKNGYGYDVKKAAAKVWAGAQYDAHNNTQEYLDYCSSNGIDANETASKDAYISSKLLYTDLLKDSDALSVKYEKGKAAKITSNVENAQSFTNLDIKGVTRDSAGNKIEVSNPLDVFSLEDRATAKIGSNTTAVNKNTVNDPKYVQSAQARDVVKNNQNQ